MYISTLSLTSVLDVGGYLAPMPGRLTPPPPSGNKLGTEFTGSWVRPQDRSGWVWEVSPPSPGLDPRTVYPVASRYTD